jgi:hypothetical protein
MNRKFTTNHRNFRQLVRIAKVLLRLALLILEVIRQLKDF